MNDPEWVLHLFVRRYGAAKTVSLLPDEMVNEVRKDAPIYLLPKDLLVLLLSYMTAINIHDIMHTCKQWYEATRMPAFWKFRVEEAKRIVISDHPHVNQAGKRAGYCSV